MELSVISPFWNVLNTSPPTRCSLPIGKISAEFNYGGFIELCEKCKKVYKIKKELKIEAALLSQFICVKKSKFKTDKGFKSMEKLKKCLEKLKQLKTAMTFVWLKDGCYDAQAPCREALDWALLRLQTVSSLFTRMLYICKEAAVSLLQRIKTGQSWNFAFFSLAVISRIWTISLYYINESCQCYEDLKKYRSLLLSCGDTWVPEDHVFPEKLLTWLGLSSELEFIKKTSVLKDEVVREMKDDEPELFQTCAPSTALGLVFREDLGETISREDFVKGDLVMEEKHISKGGKKTIVQKDLKRPLQMKTLKQVIQFIKKEKYMRRAKFQECLTRHLDVTEWNKMNMYLNQKIQELRGILDSTIELKIVKKINMELQNRFQISFSANMEEKHLKFQQKKKKFHNKHKTN